VLQARASRQTAFLGRRELVTRIRPIRISTNKTVSMADKISCREAMRGKVYLVGAGPGDPELLTLRGQRLLAEADVILHDELVDQEILRLVRPSARVENVGKRCGRKRTTQEGIHSQMVAYAAAGLVVVRLKGGDPLVFGRAGEEMEALRRAGIEFEVVPGVTAACAAAAGVRVPLTKRGVSSKIVFLSNHHCTGEALAAELGAISKDTTAIVHMPGSDYAGLAKKLHAAGMGLETPCLIVARASTAYEQVWRATLATLSEAPRFLAPVLLIVGAVAGDYSDEQIYSESRDDLAQPPQDADFEAMNASRRGTK
jgi:uroporphyrin-III C-methyltransferase